MIYNQSNSVDSTLDIILPFWKGKINIDLVSKLTQSINPDFEGDFSEYHTLYSRDGHRVYLLGLGEDKDKSKLRFAFQKLAFKTRKYWSEKIQLDCQTLDENDIKQAVTGLEMAEYKIGTYKSESSSLNPEIKHTTLLLISQNDNTEIISAGKQTGETINRIKSLVDAPSNHKTPEFIADWATDSARKFGYECKVLDKNTLQKEGFKALLAVGQGSIGAIHVERAQVGEVDGHIDVSV